MLARATKRRSGAILAAVTLTLEAEPACPGAETDIAAGASAKRLRAVRRPFDTITAETWDGLVGATEWATPFARWAFHRAWWDAYGGSAHEETLAIVAAGEPDDAPPTAIVPLMHRHEVEPTDEATHSTIRHGRDAALTPVPPQAKALFLGASYHCDYSTLLARTQDMPDVAAAVADYLAMVPKGEDRWDVVDLRRLRCGDPAADELAVAIGAREVAEGWTLNVEREDVCPVTTLPEGADLDAFLATLGKKARHEIRRKLRRAQASGEVRLELSADPLADLPAFIDLHQRRWGADGLFPPTPGGEASRKFVHRLFELLAPDGTIGLSFLTVGERRIAAGIHLQTDDSVLYYNAGVDPDAYDLSPGVVLIAKYIERALADGKRRFDFLRGDEAYKYEWGAVDEPIQRLLVRGRENG
jgi:CelD/BcsL family acetyltransferase involved in cellulose biosynthesis